MLDLIFPEFRGTIRMVGAVTISMGFMMNLPYLKDSGWKGFFHGIPLLVRA